MKVEAQAEEEEKEKQHLHDERNRLEEEQLRLKLEHREKIKKMGKQCIQRQRKEGTHLTKNQQRKEGTHLTKINKENVNVHRFIWKYLIFKYQDFMLLNRKHLTRINWIKGR